MQRLAETVSEKSALTLEFGLPCSFRKTKSFLPAFLRHGLRFASLC